MKRIMREAQEMSNSPSPDYTASPLETDLFEWHFTLRGPPGSSYADGLYHGRIVLPPTYPLRPPSFRFLTPSGRFEANREICLSISGHHEETWQPAWGVRTALVALRSFMETDSKGQLGGLDTTDAVRKRLATESRGWRCSGCGGRTNEDIIKECEDAAKAAEAEAGEGSSKIQEVEVPPELSMGFKDEMEKTAAAAAAGAAGGSIEATAQAMEDAETAELAEGFVQTVPRADLGSGTAASTAAGLAQPGQTVPRPTRTVPLPNVAHNTAVPPQQAQLLQQQHTLNDRGVPKWIDRVIAALVVCLVGMILKVILGL
ncbi:ubiquitin-conjugating enzyme [Diaporthe amygdali]|uniref:ubiquitin-conjugating enzyme n=1 Tax=Phomopsis amygdali TaxID=1214568 RepID=UPI0022FF26E8|nr:ubiquitin-conjugating enzyme [Diaporthe amygdali]KAJ0117590.1 ubiquitin-conjugating enzyme [Diaporthe amygdali]